MAGLYPESEPYEQGLLEVGDRCRVAWEICGNPRGKPAVVVHGGPGSGCTTWHPKAVRSDCIPGRAVRSARLWAEQANASEPDIDLASNTTKHLIADMELLRQRLDIERWLVLGGSWGSTLGLAYAEAHPTRVTEMILWGVTTGRRVECDGLFRGGVAVLFPEQWERLRAGVPPAERGGDIVDAYARMLHDPDAGVRQRAAVAWCMWESATPAWPPTTELAGRYADPGFVGVRAPRDPLRPA